MRIGIMLRHMDQHGGGVLVYTRNLLHELLRLETPHEFVLMYRNEKHMGTYGDRERVREVAMSVPSVVLWDQLAVPRMARQAGVDLIFNPKYSVPLAVDCPTVFVCHGLPWYLEPRWSRFSDRLSHRFLIPRYAAKADKIIAVSETTRDGLVEYLETPEERIETVYLGVSEYFLRPVPGSALESASRRYNLPDRYFLFVGQIYPPKNFGRLVQAYARVGPELGISLVVAGQHTLRSEHELALVDRLGLSDWVVRVGWVDHAALPAFYRQAEALVMPSLYEACPSPPLEAMACGCPVVTSNRYGTKEIAGEAGLLVDPEDIQGIADGMRRVTTDQGARNQLIAAGRRRVRSFSWGKCARETLRVLENVDSVG